MNNLSLPSFSKCVPPDQPPPLHTLTLTVVGYPDARCSVVGFQAGFAYLMVRVFEFATSVPSVTAFSAVFGSLTIRWLITKRHSDDT